jgi:hypothetical protein
MNVEACPQHLEISLCIDAHEALLAEGYPFARGFDAVLGHLRT